MFNVYVINALNKAPFSEAGRLNNGLKNRWECKTAMTGYGYWL